ncbi:MAG TPA: glycerate-2-kinase family protein, partial [Terriglobia bacterium]|nr:glycerate-2-kinase family protein [Terriglobia bacterium]
MNPGEAKALARGLFLKALPHLAVGPRMKQMVRLRDGVLEIARDRIRLPPGRPVRVVAMGKAAIEMTHTLAEILPHVPLRGVVAAPALPKLPLPGFEYFAGGHPYPNEESWRAAEAALALLANGHLTQDDLVIFLISGGGSALFEMPWEPSVAAGVAPGDAIPRIALQQVRQFYELLVTGGMNIQEMNTLRKRFSAVKGGRLAAAAWPARQMTLYVSDVPGQASSLVASGPTCPDDSNWGDCNDILSRYDLWGKLPASYRTLWEYGKAEETPKPGDRCFARSAYFCLLSNTDAVEQLAELTEAAGIVAEIDTRCDDWPYQNAADYLLEKLAQLRRDNPGKPVAIISGGELRCPV